MTIIHLIVVCILLFNKVFTKLSLANNKIEYLKQYIKIVESINIKNNGTSNNILRRI